MLKDISLPDIQAFVVIAQQGSFTKAADILGCSRSYLSRQLNQLEARLGVSLIIRTTRTQRLTQQGQTLFEQCQQSFNRIESAISGALESTNEIAGPLKINCVGGYIGETLIVELINGFSRRYPEIDITLDFDSRRVDLISGEFDFVFRMGRLDDSGLIARKLMDIEIVTLASPEYFKAKGRPSHPRALKQHHCITGSVKNWRFLSTSLKGKKGESVTEDVQVRGPFSCKNGHAMVNNAKAGLGIVRVPAMYCQSELANGELVPLFSEWQAASVALNLIYLQDNYQSKKLSVFKDYVIRYFESNAKQTT